MTGTCISGVRITTLGNNNNSLDYLAKTPIRQQELAAKAVADPPNRNPGKFSREQFRRLSICIPVTCLPGTPGPVPITRPVELVVQRLRLHFRRRYVLGAQRHQMVLGIVFTFSMGEEKYRIIWCAALKIESEIFF